MAHLSVSGTRRVNKSPQASPELAPIHVGSDKELEKEFATIHSVLSGKNSEWDARVESLRKLRGIVKGGGHELPQFIPSLREIRILIQTQIIDLRSQVVKEVCYLIGELAETLRAQFEPFAEIFLPNLLKQSVLSVQIMSDSSVHCMEVICRSLVNKRVVSILTEALKDGRNKALRERVSGVLVVVLEHWDDHKLERFAEVLGNCVSKALSDGSPTVRQNMRTCFGRYSELFPQRAAKLYKDLDSTVKKHLTSPPATSAKTPSKGATPRATPSPSPSVIPRSRITKPATAPERTPTGLKTPSSVVRPAVHASTAIRRMQTPKKTPTTTSQLRTPGSASHSSITRPQSKEAQHTPLPKPKISTTHSRPVNASNPSPSAVTPKVVSRQNSLTWDDVNKLAEFNLGGSGELFEGVENLASLESPTQQRRALTTLDEDESPPKPFNLTILPPTPEITRSQPVSPSVEDAAAGPGTFTRSQPTSPSPVLEGKSPPKSSVHARASPPDLDLKSSKPPPPNLVSSVSSLKASKPVAFPQTKPHNAGSSAGPSSLTQEKENPPPPSTASEARDTSVTPSHTTAPAATTTAEEVDTGIEKQIAEAKRRAADAAARKAAAEEEARKAEEALQMAVKAREKMEGLSAPTERRRSSVHEIEGAAALKQVAQPSSMCKSTSEENLQDTSASLKARRSQRKQELEQEMRELENQLQKIQNHLSDWQQQHETGKTTSIEKRKNLQTMDSQRKSAFGTPRGAKQTPRGVPDPEPGIRRDSSMEMLQRFRDSL